MRPEWNKNRQLVLKNKYLGPDEESWGDVVERIEKASGLKDKNNLLKDFSFVPAGRILRNLGSRHKDKTFFNCFVQSFEDAGDGLDSRSAIMDLFTRVFEISARGGGVGINFTPLRPKGSKVKGIDGTSTGAVSWMEAFDGLVEQISQQERRGAYMIGLEPWHPDIFNFITVKSDLNKLNNANLSVFASNDFMEAVKNDEDWDLIFPDTKWEHYDEKWDGNIHKWKANNWPIKVYDTVKAKRIFNCITKQAHSNGEPGLVFLERYNNLNIPNQDERLVSTNPCFTGNMQLKTVDGYKSFKWLEQNDPNPLIVKLDGTLSKGDVWCSGVKETVTVRTTDNRYIECTPDHEFMDIDKNMIKAKDLKNVKLMPSITKPDNLNDKFIKLGFIQGDGSLTRVNSEHHKGFEVNIGKDDIDIIKLFKNDDYSVNGSRKIYLEDFNEIIKSYKFSTKTLPNREFPKTYDNWNIKQKTSFLNGCYSANGSVVTKYRVSYKTTCKEFANKLKGTLNNDFGIKAYITTNKSKNNEFDNGVYKCKESYNIEISRYESLIKFYNNINFYHNYKQKSLKDLLIYRAVKVTSVKDNGKKEVYDFHEPEYNKGFVNNCIVSNCGELSLSKTGVCNLGSINLVKMVNKDRELDYDKLKQSVEYGVEFLDKMIDLNPYYLDSIKESQQKFRRIGLGIMGWADYLILRGIKYGSEESYKEARKLFYDIQNMAFFKSAQLAEEKGAAPIWDDYMLDNKYIKQLDPENQKYIKKHGLRNTRLLAIAPTGSIAMLAGVSSGLEPNFAFEYTRNDVLGKRKIKHWILEQNVDVDEKDLVTTHDITIEQHVKMQAAMQDYVDSSISKTVQSSEKATQKDTSQAFMLAYDTGCKGITYYRNNSRKGVLTLDDDEQIKVSELEEMFNKYKNSVIPHDVKIPKEPPVKLYKRKDNHSKKWYFFIAFADRKCTRPFALFIKTNNYEHGDVSDWVISKMERLVFSKGIEEKLIDDLARKYSGQSNIDKIARAIGLALRHNVQILDIVNVLDEIEPEFSSLLFHVKKLLEKFIPDGTEVEGNCDECGGKLVYQEGCVLCPSCGWYKCG